LDALAADDGVSAPMPALISFCSGSGDVLGTLDAACVDGLALRSAPGTAIVAEDMITSKVESPERDSAAGVR